MIKSVTLGVSLLGQLVARDKKWSGPSELVAWAERNYPLRREEREGYIPSIEMFVATKMANENAGIVVVAVEEVEEEDDGGVDY